MTSSLQNSAAPLFQTKAAGHEYGVRHIRVESETDLFALLKAEGGFSQKKVSSVLSLGGIYLNEVRMKPRDAKQLKAGDYVRFHSSPRRFPAVIEDLASRIIFENDHYLVVNKPSGVPVHSTVDNVKENLLAHLTKLKKKKMLVTHRLDSPTSGLLVIAKTQIFSREFNELLSLGEVKKMYRVLVHGLYSGDSELTHYMQPSPRAPKTLSLEPHRGWQMCKLKVIDSTEAFTDHTELVVELITGRTHQIRSQLSFGGHPIVGDRLYGSPITLNSSSTEEIALQSHFLSFTEPACIGAKREIKYFKLSQTPWSPQ